MSKPNFVCRTGADAPRFLVASDVVQVLISSSDTCGLLTLIETSVPPGGGPPMHVHEREDETFHILEGEVTLIADGKTVHAGPGTTVFAPRGSVHRFTNRTSRAARMLVAITPGGIEKMFHEVAQPVPEGFDIHTTPAPPPPEAISRLVESCARVGVRFVPGD